MLEFVPPRIRAALQRVNLHLLYELRLRAEKPLCINYAGEFVFLGEGGVCGPAHALRPTASELEDTLHAACGYSVYAVENQLRMGYLTAKGGERIGIAGTYVYEGGQVLSVREVTSLCIRVPHEILGCAEEIYARCFSDGPASLIVLAPPGEGKTTILRDLARLVSLRTHKNILVADERGELSAGDLGETADVIRFCDKLTAFTAGIRAMRPEIIVTDELLPEDYRAVRRATESGIAVFASAHLKDRRDVPEKLFAYYVTLDGLGSVKEIAGGDEHGD